MPSLFFPNPDAVRLAVAAGVIPSEVAGRSVVAGIDASGGVWVVPPDDIATSPRLARLNVRLLTPPPELVHIEWPCWAALIPLRPDPKPPGTGPLLFDLPANKLAGFMAATNRLQPQPLRFLMHEDRAILRVDSPPHYLTLTADDLGAGVYHLAARGAWVKRGWEHPLPGPAGFDPHRVALVDPASRWRVLPEVPFTGSATTASLPAAPLAATRPQVRATIRVPLKLRKVRNESETESLWMLPGGLSALSEFASEAEEKVIQHLEAAVLTLTDGCQRVALRPANGKKRHLPQLSAGKPYQLLPGRSDVFLPLGMALTPNPRPEAVARALELASDHIVVVDADPSGLVVHRVPKAAFHPLSSMMSYRVPTSHAYTSKEPTNPFALPGFVVATPTTLKTEPESISLAPVPPRPAQPPSSTSTTGTWLGRFTGLFRGKKGEANTDTAAPKGHDPLDPPQTPTPAPQRTSRARNDWAVRRAALERQVVEAGHRLDPRSRGDLWAELAALYAETGQPSDAAVCWVNAVWDRATIPVEWLDQWVRAEAKAARFGGDKASAEAVLARPVSALAARVMTALMVRAGRPGYTGGFPWTEASALLDRFEPDLPVRAVWLARQAAASAASGDPLSLARCRDRLFARLSTSGTALDLDAPSFLRFHGTPGGERFTDARDWLLRTRGTVQKWLERIDPGAGLAEFGMDADFLATAAYADFMFAWGLMKLGDRTPARELGASAEKALANLARPDANPEVHRRLSERFQALIRSADHGRPVSHTPKESVPDPLAEYALELLPLHSRILDPAGGTHRYLSHDLRGLVGGDGFGTRLIKLLSSTDDPNPALREMLAEAAASREGNRLPRAVLVGFDLSARLTPAVATELLARLPSALAWMPKLALLERETKRWEFESRMQARLLSGTISTALRFQLVEPMRAVAVHLSNILGGMDTTIREGLAKAAAPVFRGLRKLGLTTESESMLRRITDRASVSPADRLAFAVGWAAIGRESVALRALDETRDRLFVTGIADIRVRTSTAITYALALEHVQPRLALGRLEELFQRLDRVTVDGATARYYAIKPLELIDAAVTAVVTDEFALGPQVRGWLDDDEFQLRKRITKQLMESLG